MHEKSSRVMVETCLESISKNEDKINSMITVAAEDALRQADEADKAMDCLLYTSPSPRDGLLSRMPSSA